MNLSNIYKVFEQLTTKKAEKLIFFKTKDKSITYRQLLSEVEKLHVVFQNEGLKFGDKVILSTKNDYYTAIFFIALLKYGAVTVFLDPAIQKDRADSLIKKSEAKGIIMDLDLFSTRAINDDNFTFKIKIKPESQKKGKLFNRLLKSKTSEPKNIEPYYPEILNKVTSIPLEIKPIPSSHLAYIIFTSGTTSSPKGVMINHDNLFSHLKTLSKVYSIDSDSNILNILMMYHADGCIQGPLLSLFNQATWLRPFTFDIAKIEDLFNAFYKFRATHFITVPTVLSFMEKFKEGFEDSFLTEDFKFIISVASKLELNLWSNFEKTFETQILNVYGLTETVAGSFFCEINKDSNKGTIGIPVDCDAKIVKEDGNLALENEKGELQIKGNHIFKGYLNNNEATENVLKEGWLATGDIAIKDSNGFYQIVGRTKNTINAGGINIYPEQVTEMIKTNTKVLECICVGLEDENFGEKLVAALITVDNLPIEKSEITSFLRPLLEQNQIPKDFYFFNELPKGLSGKVKIKEVLALIKAKRKESSDTNIKEDHRSIIIEAAAEAFGIASENIKITDNSNTLDGWDSMGHLAFITNLEDCFKVKFSTAEMMTMNSLSNSERILMQRLNKF